MELGESVNFLVQIGKHKRVIITVVRADFNYPNYSFKYEAQVHNAPDKFAGVAGLGTTIEEAVKALYGTFAGEAL